MVDSTPRSTPARSLEMRSSRHGDTALPSSEFTGVPPLGLGLASVGRQHSRHPSQYQKIWVRRGGLKKNGPRGAFGRIGWLGRGFFLVEAARFKMQDAIEVRDTVPRQWLR